MQEGLLWFSNDQKKGLAQRVKEAADRYHFKFGHRPNLCYVHSSMLGLGSMELNGVRVVPADNVLKNHFWIGVEEETTLRRIA